MNRHKKKITFLLTTFRLGGGERNMVNLANSFAEMGFEVDILVVKSVGQYKDQINSRVRIVDMDARRIFLSLPSVVSYLRKNAPYALFATDEYTHILALVSRIIARVDTQVVLRMGNMFSTLFSQYKGFKQRVAIPFIAKRIYKYADVVIANSFGVAQDVSFVFGIPIERIKVIYNPKDIQYIKKMSQEMSGHEWLDNKTTPIVLFVGRLREQKDIPTLLRAFAGSYKQTGARLVLIGSGRDETKLRTLVEDLSIGDIVSFHGYAENPYAFMKKCDVFVTTSLWEGFSNSLQEATVCGSAIVATDCSSGPREILAPDTELLHRITEGIEYARYGVLVPVEDVDATASAIKDLLSSSDKLVSYKEKSTERGLDFDQKLILEQYKQAIGL